jgi:transcriptional regulator with XRE-family HTH domain
MIGMSVDFLSLIERGRNSPSFKKLARMAIGLNQPVAFLFNFESLPPAERNAPVKRRPRKRRR